jgi:kynurenine formamidase
MSHKPLAGRATSVIVGLMMIALASACRSSAPPTMAQPRQIIDLSPLVTEDLPVRMWGHRALKELGFVDSTDFRVLSGTTPFYYSNSYYTLMNHGGPHVDAPNHLERGGKGIDSYPLESLVGPIRLIDVRGGSVDQPISVAELRMHGVTPGDVVITLTGYTPPTDAEQLPTIRALSKEAAEYLAQIPVRAFATDSLSADAWGLNGLPYGESVHHVFLSRGIPIIEQLTNVEALINVPKALFVALPLKVKDGDGSPIRAAAFVY